MSRFGYTSLGFGSGASAPAFENDFSINFDGADDAIETEYEPTSASTISFTFWVKSSDVTEPMGFFSNLDSGTHNISFLTPNNTKSFYTIINNADGSQSLINGLGGTNSTLDVRDGNWHHLALTINGNSVKMYKDGGDDAINVSNPSNTQGTAWVSSTISTADGWSADVSYSGRAQPFYIGTMGDLRVGNLYWFDGQIDEFGIFQSELSGSDVSAIYNNGLPASLSTFSPSAWYRMGDGTGDTDSGGGTPTDGDVVGTVADQSGNGNNATGENATYSNEVPT